MLRESTILVGDIALNLAVGPPSGPPLLLLHGVSRSWTDFVPILPALLPRWQVHGLDFRGHGRSGRGAGHYLILDHVHDVVALLEQHFREPVVLFGHSLGALVALGAAAIASHRVRAVILEDPPSPTFVQNVHTTSYYATFVKMRELAGSNQPLAEIARSLADVIVSTAGGNVRLGDLRDATSLRYSARCLQNLDPEVLTPLLEERWLVGSDLDGWAANVKCPALLLRGNEMLGGMLTRPDAERLARAMADCLLVDVPQVGHLIHQLEAPTAARLVTGFLESLSRTSP